MKRKHSLILRWKPFLYALPVLLAVTLVPLMVFVRRYDTGLTHFPWFSNTVSTIDLFLYWKGQGLIFLALIMLLILIQPVYIRHRLRGIRRRVSMVYVVPVLCYLVLALLSSLSSQYQDFALSGSYEQWEGMNVLAAYGMLFFYTYAMADRQKVIRLLVYGILLGGFGVGMIGAFQFMHMDLFRSEAGRFIMNLLNPENLNFSFNFSEGWVYSTLYNPNYVGSYVALVLPVVIAVAVLEWKKIPIFWTILSMVDVCVLTVTLLGSQSMTGCVGVIVSALFLVIFMARKIWSQFGWKKIVVAAAALAVFAGILCGLFPEAIRFGVDKVFRPKEDYHLISQMLSTEKGLEVSTVDGNTFYIVLTGDGENPLTMTDKDTGEVPLEKNQEKNYYTPQDDRYTEFRFYPENIYENGMHYDGLRIFNPSINKKWVIAKVGDEYMIYNAFHKLDSLRPIPAWGFSGNQHFGDKRGYIWSRTFPLLKNYILLGSGPNTFTEVFPNDDYVGKTNMNYDGVMVTKPHNMYLQIWVQTGFLSLVAFVALYLLYFVSSIRLYYNRKYTPMMKLGVAFMIGTFGYMVTGLANDSTVTVAPLYWMMLGLGLAINRVNSVSKIC